MQILFNKWSEVPVNKKVCIFIYWGYGHIMTLETF